MCIEGARLDIAIRLAVEDDIPVIVALLAGDEFNPVDAWSTDNQSAYKAAFDAIAASNDNALYVVALDSQVVGTFTLTFMPVFYNLGAHRMILEAVAVKPDLRSKGIGAQILAFSEQEARGRGALQLALTSKKQRHDAHRFYENNGYVLSHDGFRKQL